MAIGSFMGRVFTVSHTKIFTPSNLKGSTGSDWATHEVVGGKARSEWVGPKLKRYTFDLLLRAQDGVPPRSSHSTVCVSTSLIRIISTVSSWVGSFKP